MTHPAPRPSMPCAASRRSWRPATYLVALALGVLSACDRSVADAADRRAASAAPVRADVERELARRHPDLAFTFRAPDSAAAPYRMLWFEYQTRGKPWPYGTGFALWRDGDRAPRWHHLQHGDFGPHTLFWTDVNRDGREDVFYLAGEEDVYSTYLFVDGGAPSVFTDSAFTLAYGNENDYSALVDLDADGTPEIIDSGHPGAEHVDAPGCEGLELPPDVREDAVREYRRIVGAFDEANFHGGMVGYDFYTLHLLAPVKILAIHGAHAVDVTRELPDHLRWRVALLDRLRSASDGSCRGTIDGVIAHLRRNLAAAPGA